MNEKEGKTRLELLDNVRGILLVSMICYHGTWNMVNFFGADWEWYGGIATRVWQQLTCCLFILLSGFCWSLGKRPLKRGVTVFAAGALVSTVTALVVPEQRILFGILTFIGSAMILMVPLHPVFRRISPWVGFAGSLMLFLLFRNVQEGYLSIGKQVFCYLPDVLYDGMGAAFLGFLPPDFYSSDYFPLLPWFFLFTAGYFLYGMVRRRIQNEGTWSKRPDGKTVSLSMLGRNSLSIYLLHQPVLYIAMTPIFAWIE